MLRVPSHWACEKARQPFLRDDIFVQSAILTGIAMALDVCQEMTDFYDHQEGLPEGRKETAPEELYARESSALEFLAIYADWTGMAGMLNGAQIGWLIENRWPKEDPETHRGQLSWVWCRGQMMD